jgi:hypothetical protein
VKTISLLAAMEILRDCAAVIIDDNGLCYPSIFEDSEDFLFLKYEDEEGSIFHYIFTQTDNREGIKIAGSSMFLIDGEGDEIQITILAPRNIETHE